MELNHFSHGHLEINHFSHDHHLVLSEETFHDIYRCDACGDPIVGLCYCCLECPYILHKWCAELPRELTLYELHPDHPLILILESSEEEDSICGSCKTGIGSGFIYRCAQCSFNLHADCASLPKQIIFELGDPDLLPARKFDYVGTEMNLTFLKKTYCSVERYECFFCEKEGMGSRFIVVSKNDEDIIYSFHIQCVMFPKTVKHERHRHDLTLHVPIEKDFNYDEWYCDVCEQDRDPNDWVYYCESCELAAHLGCGITRSNRPRQGIVETNHVYTHLEEENDFELNEMRDRYSTVDLEEETRKEAKRRKERTLGDGKGLQELKHFSHDHPLILYDEQWNVTVSCHACSISIFGKTYICNDCEFYLHKWCAELPREIHHSLHSTHSLTLVPMHDFECKYCRKCDVAFSFSCEECDFDLHTTCGLLPENPIHESHEHPLIAVISTPYIFREDYTEEFKLPIRFSQMPPCNACQNPCDGLSLECSLCGFYLHLVCALYPPIGKAKTHRHSLALTYSFQEDPNALEFICDACEEPRIPNCWLYRCLDAKCNFVAHVDCAVPKLFLTQEVESKHQVGLKKFRCNFHLRPDFLKPKNSGATYFRKPD